MTERHPLTSWQRDIWMAAELLPEHPEFTAVLRERLEGELDLDLLTESLGRVLRRNDALNLRFDEGADGTPHQWVSEEPLPVHRVDLSHEPDPAGACAAWMDRARRRTFRLRRAPVVEAAVLVESPRVAHVHLTVHHIVMDGGSAIPLLRQLGEEYRWSQESRDPRPGDPPSYLAVVRDETAYRDSPAYRRDREAHREALATAEPALFGRKAPAGERRHAQHTFVLDGPTMDRVRRAGFTPFPYLAAVFGGYLARVLGAEEVIIGVPLLNRRTREREIVGHFANTLPLRVPALDGRSLRELVEHVQGQVTRLLRHGRVSLGDVLRDQPGGAGRQLFDTTLSFQQSPDPGPVPGIERTPSMLANGHEQDALNVYVRAYDGTDDVLVELLYAEDVFDEDFPITAVADQLKRLIGEGVDLADRPVADLPLLTAQERADLVARLGRGPRVAFDEDATLHELFEARAALRPGQTAVVDMATGRSLTYGELDARANRLARALRARGVGPDDRVAVVLERGLDLPVALFGVLKAGGAYVPVDPGHPAERIRLLLEDSRARVVLVGDRPSSAPADVHRMGDVHQFDMHRIGDLLDEQPSDAPLEPLAGPRDLAYVIYTSGSTGEPKGVMVEHRSVVHRLAWMQRAYPLDESDTLLQKTPATFDVSVWELFWWAVEGARLALLPPGAEKDPKELLRAVRDHRVTALHFVPSMLGPFLELLSGNSGLKDDAAALRTVFCSGEALPAALVEQFARILGGGPEAPRLVNLYGPTETTVDVSCHECPTDPGGPPVRRVPIGRPIDNTRLYVLDPRGEPQPAGVPGELCVAGVQVARGYLDRPELTEGAFVDDPFVPGERMYRTRDIARWLADGTLEYLGRADGQVKIRGNRVETGEVAAALTAVPGVYDAVVVDRTTPALGTHLVGFYVAGHDPTPRFLRAQLARTLPEYMIPSVFRRIDRIPLTPNGKTDRRALPEPEPGGTAGVGGEDPVTPVEKALADIWAEVLQAERVGRHDDYFALGGDSITLLRIRTLAERRGLRLTLNDVMRHPTVAALAATVTDREGLADDDLALAPFALVPAVDRAGLSGAEDAHPVSRLQLGLLHHGHHGDRPALYKDVFRYSVETRWSEGSEAAFRRAFDRLVARHPVLRSSFDVARFSEPLQIVHAEVPSGLEIVDPSSDSSDAEIQRYVDSRRVHEYVLDRAPLYRLRVYPRPDSVELVLSFHHAILDGGSVANLVGELLCAYAYELGGEAMAPDWTPLPHPALHVREERRALASPEARDHWRRLLAGAELLQLDGLRPHGPVGTGEQVVHEADVPADVMAAVRRLARENNLSVKSVFLAAYCLTLRLFGGTPDGTCDDDVVTGVITHTRPGQAGAERILGLFLNTVPFRLRTGVPTWLHVAHEALRQEREGHAHRRYPLSAVQQDLGSPVTETAFNYVYFRQLAEVSDRPDVRLRSIRTWEETSFVLLGNVIVAPAKEWTRLRLDCDGRTISREQAALFADTWLGILARMARHPGERPDFAFLAPAPERATPDRAAAGEEARHAVVQRFTDQARRTPDAIALVCGEQRWSYGRLAAASESVARRLLTLGMPVGARLGLAMDRSPEAVAVLLGILRAGAAVVPLDTGFPPERLTAMACQAEPFRIIADERYAELLGGMAELLPAEGISEPTDDTADTELPAVTPDSLAYVLFTSGSTGVPKGVAMPHRSLANLVAWQNRRPSGAVGGRTLQYAPLSFDVSLQEIFSTLCGGGTLCLVSPAERRDPPALLRRIDQDGVERIFLPYVALQQLAEAAVALGLTPRALRVLVSSGERLRVTEEIRALLGNIPGALLENQYGPTESHVVTSHPMTGDPAAFPALPPIGRPIDGTEVLVLDSRRRPVPPGARGELYVGGTCLAQGYLGRPDLTAERFVDHPFGDPGELLYRTGDLGLVLPGGDIVCAGRTDTQVKVRGHRVETAEIELALHAAARDAHLGLGAGTPGLKEAAVVARSHPGGDTSLAAFLVGDENRTDMDALRSRLRAVLPAHMLPAHFTWLPALPLTPSGKRDDTALRAIPLTPTTTTEGTKPVNAYEQALAEIVSDLIHVPEIGVHDNIFDLGATSLTTMRLVVTIEQRYGVNIPIAGVLETPTVADLARRLSSAHAVPVFDPLVPIRPGGGRRPLFLVHPMGGNVLCYLPLARHLPADQPLYALQAAGADPATEPLRSMEALAASYIEALRRVQPRGPYRIGGWSFGGYVAFEMARQLTAAGEEVTDLFVLDTTAVTPGERHRHTEDELLVWFFWELLLLERGGRSPVETIPPHRTTLTEKFEYIAELAVAEGVLPAGTSSAVVRRLFDVYAAHWTAALDYRPTRLPLDLILLRATEPLPQELRPMHDAMGTQYNDRTNGWHRLVDGHVEVLPVPGDHLTLMEEPQVKTTAETLLTAMRRSA